MKFGNSKEYEIDIFCAQLSFSIKLVVKFQVGRGKKIIHSMIIHQNSFGLYLCNHIYPYIYIYIYQLAVEEVFTSMVVVMQGDRGGNNYYINL